MITADQILAHAVGDYVLQSDWMATEKTRRSVAALVHVIIYTLCFVPLTQSPAALFAIASSHFVIDRWRLARYVAWAKNVLLDPSTGDKTLAELGRDWQRCSATGYAPERPAWLATWLMIIVDQILHLVCNGIAVRYL